MSFGEAFGAFASGAMGGAALGKSFKGMKPLAATKIVGGSDGGKPVGFGIGEDLVSGTLGSSSTAAGDTKSSSPWSFLSGILGNLSGDGGNQ
jgi:hypothetical protein